MVVSDQQLFDVIPFLCDVCGVQLEASCEAALVVSRGNQSGGAAREVPSRHTVLRGHLSTSPLRL